MILETLGGHDQKSLLASYKNLHSVDDVPTVSHPRLQSHPRSRAKTISLVSALASDP